MSERMIATEDELKRCFVRGVVLASLFILLAMFFRFPFAFQIIVPLVFMAYYYHSYQGMNGHERLRPMFADSLYYMGFILTVASLTASLLPFALNGAPPRPEELLGRFGVALTTTFVGIIGRTVIINFRADMDILDNDARLGVREQAEALRRELERTVKDFNGFNGDLAVQLELLKERIEQDVASLYQLSLGSVKGVMDEAQKLLAESMRQSSATLDASMRGAYAGLEQSMRDSSRLLEESLVKTVASVDLAVGGLSKRLGSIELDPTAIRDAVVLSFGGITEELRKLSLLVNESHEALSVGLGRMRQSIEGSAALDEELLGLRQASQGLREVGQELGGLTGRFGELHEAIDGAVTGGGRIVQRMDEQARGIESILGQTERMGQAMGDYLGGMRRLVEGLEKQGEALGGVRERMENEISGLEQETRQYFGTLREASRGYAEALRDMGGFIADSMRDLRGKRSTH